jgi:GT2 family glycosyltransferase
MIAFASPITDARAFELYAEPGIRRASEPDSQVLAYRSPGSIFRAFNVFCDQAAKLDGLEALVLLHQDAELVDPDFCARVRAVLSDPEVAIVGCAGAVGVRSLAWWEGAITWARFTHRFDEMGGGEVPGLSWEQDPPAYARTGEVDAIDGVVIVMSPWAVRELRFDESLGQLHGYDVDICLQAREAGRKVVAADIGVVHHHPLELVGDPDSWVAAHMALAEKWEQTLEGEADPDWRRRARRAEALLELTRVRLRLAEHHITRLSEDFEGIERTRSWRLTSPLRKLTRLARRLRHPSAPRVRELGEGVVRPGSEGAPDRRSGG